MQHLFYKDSTKQYGLLALERLCKGSNYFNYVNMKGAHMFLLPLFAYYVFNYVWAGYLPTACHLQVQFVIPKGTIPAESTSVPSLQNVPCLLVMILSI